MLTQAISSSVDAASLSQHVAHSTLLLPSLEQVSLDIVHRLGNKRVRKDTRTPTVPFVELKSLLSVDQTCRQCLIYLLDLCRQLHVEVLPLFSHKGMLDGSNRPKSTCFKN
jgi:hypothetical protein